MSKNITGTKLQGVDADPGKAFFVDMLTRDLSLEDAILDLLEAIPKPCSEIGTVFA